jgi:beta-glucosidase
LSYTRFVYSALEFQKQVRTGANVEVKVRVKNAGAVAGDEVVQLYVKKMAAGVPVPIRSLQGFRRIPLKPGQSEQVSFTLTPRQLSLIDKQNRRVVEPGQFELAVGGGQPGPRTASTQVAAGRLAVTGQPFFIR